MKNVKDEDQSGFLTGEDEELDDLCISQECCCMQRGAFIWILQENPQQVKMQQAPEKQAPRPSAQEKPQRD